MIVKELLTNLTDITVVCVTLVSINVAPRLLSTGGVTAMVVKA